MLRFPPTIWDKPFSGIILAILLFFAIFSDPFGDTVQAQPPPPGCPTCSPDIPRTIYAPTIGLPEADTANIVLNCRSSHVMDVTPTFFSEDGQAIVGQEIHLQPSEIRFVTVESLIPADHRNHTWGGMNLHYFGKLMEVWAQITLPGLNERGSSDVTFSILNNAGSDTQEAVWWQPRPGKQILALGNSSSSPVHTSLQFSSGEVQEVDIAPYATNYIRKNFDGGSPDGSESVRLTTIGPSGSLKANGYVMSSSNSTNHKFASSIRFYDPGSVVQPKLFATNFRARNSSSHMLLKNISNSALVAGPVFKPIEGSGATVSLPTVSINSGETIDVDLQPLLLAAAGREDLESVSVEVINDSGPGTLIGALYAKNLDTGIRYDIPLRDSGVIRNSTGSYPWRLDDDYTSTITVTNVGTEPVGFRVTIFVDGGRYMLKPPVMYVGQTSKFDLKTIRDEQIPDEEGRVIPTNATVGQFSWSIIRASSNTRLIGRSEVVSRSHHVSSSYSCNHCCPDSGPSYQTTQGVALRQDDTLYFSATESWYTCYGFSWYTAGDVPGLYTVQPSTATAEMVDHGVMEVDGMSSGAAMWYSGEYTYFYSVEGPYDCYSFTDTTYAQGSIQVAPTVNITAIKAVGKDLLTSIRVLITNPDNIPITLTLTPNSGTAGAAQFTSTNTDSRQITQTSNVEVRGITESSTKRGMRLEAKFTNADSQIISLGTMDFTVIAATLSIRFGNSDAISPDNNALPYYQSYLTRTTLGGPFLSSGSAPSLWRIGIEIKATILPSDFDELLTIERVFNSRTHNNQTLIANYANCADTSSIFLLDSDPQSNGSHGKVYDLDAPGINIPDSFPSGYILRVRTNFSQWVSVFQLNGEHAEAVRVSAFITWYERLSLSRNTGTGTSIINDVSTDDLLNAGVSNLTWNLAADGKLPSTNTCPN